jgi:hypothetical protein
MASHRKEEEMRKRILVLSCLFLLLPLNIPGATAATGSLGISPILQEITLEEGVERKAIVVELANNTASVQTLTLEVRDFGSLDDSGGVAFLGTDTEVEYGLRSWASLDKDRISLDPGQKQKVTVFIENRESLSPGGHYGALVATVAQEGGLEGESSEVALKSALSSLFFLKKMGGEVYALEAERLTVTGTLWKPFQSADLRFKNAGNVHAVPRGTVEVVDPKGDVVFKGNINQSSYRLLPESFRTIPTQLIGVKTPWLPGTYKVTATFRAEGTDDMKTITLDFFWYLPLAGLALVIFLLAAILLLIRKKYSRKS